MSDEPRIFADKRMGLVQKKREYHQSVDEGNKELAERTSERERRYAMEIARLREELEACETGKVSAARESRINILELEEQLANAKMALATAEETISEAEKRHEASEGTIKKLQDQMKANRENYDNTLEAMEKQLKECSETGVQNGHRDGVCERDRLAAENDKLVDKVKVLRTKCESKSRKLADANDRLAHKKTRKEECLKERKSEYDQIISRYDQIISSMQEKCDREVNLMRERMEEEKEAVRKELQKQNDLNCSKWDEQLRLLVEGQKEVVSHHGQEMAALRSTFQAEKESMEADMREMERKWKEERKRLEDLLQREKVNREKQSDEYEQFKNLLREEKVREIEFVKVKCEQENEGLRKEHSKIFAQKEKEILSLAEGHREEMSAKAAEYEQEKSKLKDEMAALRQTFDKERTGLDKSLTDLITKHRKSEKDLETHHKEKEEKLREEVDTLKRQLSEKIHEIELLQCQVTLQS